MSDPYKDCTPTEIYDAWVSLHDLKSRTQTWFSGEISQEQQKALGLAIDSLNTDIALCEQSLFARADLVEITPDDTYLLTQFEDVALQSNYIDGLSSAADIVRTRAGGPQSNKGLYAFVIYGEAGQKKVLGALSVFRSNHLIQTDTDFNADTQKILALQAEPRIFNIFSEVLYDVTAIAQGPSGYMPATLAAAISERYVEASLQDPRVRIYSQVPLRSLATQYPDIEPLRGNTAAMTTYALDAMWKGCDDDAHALLTKGTRIANITTQNDGNATDKTAAYGVTVSFEWPRDANLRKALAADYAQLPVRKTAFAGLLADHLISKYVGYVTTVGMPEEQPAAPRYIYA